MNDRRVLSFQPESGFYHKRAIKYIDKQDYTAALKNLRRAVEMEPDNLTYRLDIADTYARMGLYERSNLEIQLMFHLKDMPTEALFGMASNFMAMGDYDQAETMFKAYEKMEPEGEFIEQANEALGYIAECDYETPLDRELDELSMDGKAALDAGDLDHAIDCLERALEKDPEMIYVRNNLAVAYYCVGNMEKAWEHIRKVVKDSPLDVHGRCNESMFYLADGDREHAVESVRKLRLDRIEEIDELFKLCLALADAGLDHELMQALKKIFVQCPYDASMLYLYGACLYNQGRYSESLMTFEKLKLTDPDSLLAAYGIRLANFACRGEAAVERIPYTFELPEEMQCEISECLEALTGRTPQDVAQALKDEQTRRYIHAAVLAGTEQQMGQAVLLLGYSASPEAERMLRELLLSPTHSSYFKQMVIQTLRSTEAQEPYYCLQDGKLVMVRTRKFEFDPKIPESYLRVMRDAVNHMSQNYDEEGAVEYVAGLWVGYIMALDGHYPRMNSESAWIRALEGLYLESIGNKADWGLLAQEAGVSERTLNGRRKKLLEVSDSVKDQERGGK